MSSFDEDRTWYSFVSAAWATIRPALETAVSILTACACVAMLISITRGGLERRGADSGK
jgi:hypothetical protein